MADFLIIIPAYNEQNNIVKVLDGIRLLNLDADVLVINDGSVDETEARASGHSAYVISHPTNLGYGAALQSGFKFAKIHGYRHIIQFDADDQHNPEDIRVIMEELSRGESDVVIGSRFLGNPDFNPGKLKKTAILLFKMLIYLFTHKKISDPTSGLRGLSRRVFSYYSITDRFPADFPDADILIQMLMKRFKVKEVPIQARERLEGVSMHSGARPVIYLFKIIMSILSVLLGHLFLKRGRNDE